MAGKRKFDLTKTKAALSKATKQKPPEKLRTTFYLNPKIYREFQALCKNRGASTSEIVESLMVDLLDEIGAGKPNG